VLIIAFIVSNLNLSGGLSTQSWQTTATKVLKERLVEE
jgi:hypothetical protein